MVSDISLLEKIERIPANKIGVGRATENDWILPVI
jgi:hypothetical protein